MLNRRNWSDTRLREYQAGEKFISSNGLLSKILETLKSCFSSKDRSKTDIDRICLALHFISSHDLPVSLDDGWIVCLSFNKLYLLDVACLWLCHSLNSLVKDWIRLICNRTLALSLVFLVLSNSGDVCVFYTRTWIVISSCFFLLQAFLFFFLISSFLEVKMKVKGKKRAMMVIKKRRRDETGLLSRGGIKSCHFSYKENLSQQTGFLLKSPKIQETNLSLSTFSSSLFIIHSHHRVDEKMTGWEWEGMKVNERRNKKNRQCLT